MEGSLWRVSKFGAPNAINSPDDLISLANDYFKWCEENPIKQPKQHKIATTDASGTKTETIEIEWLPLDRPFTLAGFWVHSGIKKSTWYDYKKKPVFSEVIESIDNIMREQKFSGASVGIFNPNIIARDLGLADKTENTIKMTDDFDSLIGECADDD